MGQSSSTTTVDTVATETCNNGGLIGGLFRSSQTKSSRNSILNRLSEQLSLETSTAPDIISNGGSRRHLQSNCDFFYILKISIVYDNTFCDENGGKDNSEAIIRRLVDLASFEYESKICLTLEIGYLEGYCGSTQHEFSDLIDIGNANDRLNEFKAIFDLNVGLTGSEKGLAYYFSGCGTEMFGDDSSTVVGIAFPRGLCRLNRDGYGIIVYTGVTATNCKGALTVLLHEIGHNVGGFNNHTYVEGGPKVPNGLVMSEDLCSNGCDSFTELEVETLDAGLFRIDLPDIPCISETTEPGQKITAVPTASPVPDTSIPLLPVSPPTVTIPETLEPTLPDLPPSVIFFPTISPTVIPTQRPTQISSAFPIALPATLGTGVLAFGGWYARRRFGK